MAGKIDEIFKKLDLDTLEKRETFLKMGGDVQKNKIEAKKFTFGTSVDIKSIKKVK